MQILLIGVSGSGKTTLGRALAEKLGRPLIEGDAFHSAANLAKMKAGTPLDDADRMPWLAAIAEAAAAERRAGHSPIICCSALKRSYRDILRRDAGPVLIVHLSADRRTLGRRLAARKDHFMPASLLDSQLATFEPPQASERALTLAADAPLDDNVAAVIAAASGES